MTFHNQLKFDFMLGILVEDNSEKIASTFILYRFM